MITLRAGSATDVGRVRSVNEDLAFVSDDIYGVADGMGGHAGGDVAARTAVEALQEAFRSNPTIDGLLAAVQEANAAVWEHGNTDVDLRGMGTTQVTVVANVEATGDDAETIVLVNVGDSRAYLLRSGDLEQLTNDHSVAEELVARGELTPDQAALHPQRHILTRALGVAPEVDVDAWEFLPRTGDRYLLCSDGLSNELPESVIAGILESVPEPQRAAQELVSAANEHGGSDNITAVVLDVVNADAQALTADQAAMFSGGSEGGSGLAQGQVALTRTATSASPGAVGTLERAQARPPEGAAPTLEKAESAKDRRARSRAAERQARAHSATEQGSPIITGRLLVFIVVVIAVLAGAWGVVRLYLNSSYFLAVDSGQIVVDQGKPGGFLWFNPNVVERTGVTTSEVPSYQVSGIRDGSFTESSAGAAQALVRRMVLSKCDYDQGVPSATPTTSPPSGVPTIALCPPNPTPQVTPPPSTSTTTSTSTTSTGSTAGSTSTTAATGTTG